MEGPHRQKLKFLHSENSLMPAKLEFFRRLTTDAIKTSLSVGQAGSLKVRPDATLLDGHHRLSVLLERGEEIDGLQRKIMERDL